MLRGNFGMAMEWRRPVTEVIGDRLGLTMVVSIAAVLLTWASRCRSASTRPCGQYSIGDYVFTLLGFIGLAMPSFLLALLVLYFGFVSSTPTSAASSPPQYVDAPWSWARSWICSSTCRSRR